MIGKGLPLWANGIRQIKRWEISIQTIHWLEFISNHLLPLWNGQGVTIERAIIIRCLIDYIIVNPRELIAKIIKLRSKKSGTFLPF